MRGLQNPSDTGTQFDALAFLIQQMIGRINTAMLVQVKAVTNSGGVSPVGFVDIQPLVNQVDGDGNATPHGVINQVPYFRLQGGSNAIIADPEVGDIGIAVFSSHDHSSVAENKQQSNPGSWRRFAMADGLYIGGFLNGAPTQYVRFNSSGIEIHSNSLVKLSAPDVQISAQTVEITATTSAAITTPTFTVNGDIQLNGGITQGAGGSGGAASFIGPVSVTNDVSAGGKSLKTHTHSGVQTGSGNTGQPN